MSIRFHRSFALSALALAASCAHADYTLDIYAPPANAALMGISANGSSGVTDFGTTGATGTTGTAYLPSPLGSFANIGGNAVSAGFSGGPGISANGALINSNATAANGFSQAATYNTATGTWTTLGSLGYNSTSAVGSTGLKQQSYSTGISSDGSTVVGGAYFNTTGTTGSASHPVVFRNGAVIDLNAAGGTQSGRALAVSADGSVVAGYASNSAAGTIWTWNGSSYVASAPSIVKPGTSTVVAIQANKLSDNGVWATGGSVNGLATNYSPPFTFPTTTYSPATLWNTQTNTALLIPYDHVINTTVGGADTIVNMKASVSGVSNNGTVIGSFDQCLGCSTGLFNQDTWIYSAQTGVTMSFDSYLASVGVALAPTQHVWELYSMSADGSAISGIYWDTATSTSSAFVLRNISAVPEPGSWMMFGLALPLLVARRMQQQRRREA